LLKCQHWFEQAKHLPLGFIQLAQWDLTEIKVFIVHLYQAMLKRQFQRKFENMKRGQSDKDEEHSDCSLQEEGHTGSGKDIQEVVKTYRKW